MMSIRTTFVGALALTLVFCVSSFASAQPSEEAKPAEPATAFSHEHEGPTEIAPEMLPFVYRDVAILLICLAGTVAIIVLGMHIPSTPVPFFAAGILFLMIDPLGDLVIFHILKSTPFQNPNLTYAGVSALSTLLGVVFIVLGVHRMRDLMRRTAP